jgi:hypothetical protein
MIKRILSIIAILATIAVLVNCSKTDASKVSAVTYEPKPAKLKNADIVSDGAQCTVDSINHKPADNLVASSKKQPLAIDGWVFSLTVRDPAPSLVYVMLSSDIAPPYYFEAKRNPRPDVASVKNNPLLVNSGFNLTSDISTLPVGVYQLRLITGKDYLAFVCYPGISIQVTE